MAQQERALVAENLGSVPRAHMAAHSHSRGSSADFGRHQAGSQCADTQASKAFTHVNLRS